MSKQKQIVDAMITALSGISSVNKVTQDMTEYSQSDDQDYNVVFVNPKRPEVDRFAYLHPTSDDMMARMEVIVEGNVWDEYADDIDAQLDQLSADVETALTGDSALSGLTIEVVLSEDDYTTSVDDRYGIFSATYVVEYLYNHLSP